MTGTIASTGRVSLPWKDVVADAKILLRKRRLNSVERDFVKSIRDDAKRFKRNFTITTKQAAWWSDLIEEDQP